MANLNLKFIPTPEYKQIVEAGKAQGVKFNEPNPKCKKCYGRGWVGKDSKTDTPLICNCIIPKSGISVPKQGDFHFRPRNRKEKRLQMKNDLAFIKNVKSSFYKDELTKTDNGLETK